MKQFLIQMHGESGAGKSTLALAVGRATGAVVIDKDPIKGPLIDGGIEDPLAGGLAYDVLWLLVESLLDQSMSVVLDTPAYWPAVLDRSRGVAEEHSADFYLVECRCDDLAEQERRLASRQRFASQPASRSELAAVLARPGVVTTLDAPRLTIDTLRPLDECVDQVLEYLRR